MFPIAHTEKALFSGSCLILSHHPGNAASLSNSQCPTLSLPLIPPPGSLHQHWTLSVINYWCMSLCASFLSPHLNERPTQAARSPTLFVASQGLLGSLVHKRCSITICWMNEQMCAFQYIYKAPFTVFLLKASSSSLRKIEIFHFTMPSPLYRWGNEAQKD